jgi:hypothetical protein
MERTLGFATKALLLLIGLFSSALSQARGDLLQLNSDPSFYTSNVASNDSSFIIDQFDPSATPHTYNFDSGTGFTGTSSASIVLNDTLGPSGLSGAITPTTSLTASNTDPGNSHAAYNAYTQSNVDLTFTLSQAAVMTATFNPTLNLGSTNINTNTGYQDSFSQASSGGELTITNNTTYAYTEIYGAIVQNYSATAPPSFSQVLYIDSQDAYGNTTNTDGDSFTILLAPGEYTLSGSSESTISFYHATGTYGDPFAGGTATFAIAPAPEASSLVLLGLGLSTISVIAVARRGVVPA